MKGRFNLLNDRLPQWGDLNSSSTADEESSQTSQIKSTLNLNKKGVTISFISKIDRLQDDITGDGCQKVYDAKVDHHGNHIDRGQSIAASKFLQFTRAKVEHGIHVKKRIDTSSMRRILDNTHEILEDTISRRVEVGKIKGSKWSLRNREGDEGVGSELGPGHYDVDRYYKSRLVFDSIITHQFSELPSGHLPQPSDGAGDFSNTTTHRSARNWRRLRTLSTNTGRPGSVGSSQDGDRNHAADGGSNNSSSGKDNYNPTSTSESVKNVKFGASSRWEAPEYRKEIYSKTTGLLLSPDFDKSFKSKKIAVNLTSTVPRTVVFDSHSITSGIELDPDWGPKASISTSVKRHPVRLAAAFKSTVESGFHPPGPTSGANIGPGSFPGAETTAVIVNNPKHRSACFLAPRPKTKPKVANIDSSGELPKFSVVHKKGPTFELDGNSNNHMEEWTMKKIMKIYPKKFKDKF